jgi:hypothetical protein
MMTVHVHAQRVHFIPKVGYNMSDIAPSLHDSRHGVNFGVSFEYEILPRLSVETGVYYSMQGSSYKLDEELHVFHDFINGHISIHSDMQNDYINVPLLAKGYIYHGLHLYAGLQTGFLVHSRLNLSSDISLENVIDDGFMQFEDIDLSDYENKIDLSGVIGAGYRFDIGLLVSVNYNAGIVKLFRTENIPFHPDMNAKNNVLQVNIGWVF